MVVADYPDLGAYAPGLESVSLLDAVTASLISNFNGVLITDYQE